MEQKSRYGLSALGAEVETPSLFIPAQTEFWVVEAKEGHVPATSVRADTGLFPAPPAELKTWETAEAALRFAQNWRGHPWWCKPTEYKVIEVLPIQEQRRVGWLRVNPSNERNEKDA